MTTVLVTGVGAIIGYGILKSLRRSQPDIGLVGIDASDDAVGQKWCDRFYQVPPTVASGYPEVLRDILIEKKIDFVIPGIEQDCHFFSDNRGLFDELAVCLNDQRLIDLSKDKWATYQELQVAFPDISIPSFDKGNFEELAGILGLPFIVKPRRSYASKGLVRITNAETFAPLASSMSSRLIAQPLIGSDDEEYTVSAFGDGHGNCLAYIALQRRLAADGSTAKATVRKDLDIENVLVPLFTHFKPVGPTNLQFRRVNGGWKLLEINPRISSATSIRAAFGYNEAAMAVDFFLHNKPVQQPEIHLGNALRYIEDSITYDRHYL